MVPDRVVRFMQLTGLSKNLREALRYLSSEAEVTLLLSQLAECVEQHKTIPEDLIELDLEPAELIDWTKGVEHLKTKTEDELYELLGFKDKKIPFLASEIDEDTDIGVQLYNDKIEENMEPRVPRKKKPLRLRWHQLVGLVKLMQCALTSNTVLLMDSMGMGKTIQILSFFSVLAYYRQFFEETNQYPGQWCEYLFARYHF